MRLLLLGDAHITDRKPIRRKDENYLDTILSKLNQVEQIGVKRKCKYVLQSGDWFDSWRVGCNVICELIKFLKKSSMEWFCIWGQHDIYGHSADSFSYSSLRVLQEAGVVKVLEKDPISLLTNTEPEILLYGASFGQDVPFVTNVPWEKSAYKILVVHQMIGDVLLYPDQNLIHPSVFLRQYCEFDFVLAGDYHYRFSSQLGGRVCVNPGALVRKTISENDLKHKPAVIIFDTGTNECEIIELKVVPIEEIFDLEVRPEREDPNYERLLQFLESIKRSSGTAVGWKKILSELIVKEKVPDRVVELVDGCIAKIVGVK